MQVKKDELRDRIVAAATSRFVRDGFEETSVSAIAAEGAVGKGTIYTYFDSKESLLDACASAVFQELADTTNRAVEANADLGGFVHDLVRGFFTDLMPRLRVLLLYHRKDHGRSKAYAAMTRPFAAAVKSVHAKYLPAGGLSYDELYASLTALLMSSFILHEGMSVTTLRAAIEKTLICLLASSGR